MRRRKKLTNQQAARIGVSRTTAWRSRKRGWYCPGYHKRYVKPGQKYLPEPQSVLRLAYSCAIRVCDSLGLTGVGGRDTVVQVDDLAQIAALRALEVRNNRRAAKPQWLFAVMRNAVRDALKKERIRARPIELPKSKRKAAPRRACVACGTKVALTSHHVFPRRFGGKATVILCAPCHGEVENFYMIHEQPDECFVDDFSLMKHYIGLFSRWLSQRRRSWS